MNYIMLNLSSAARLSRLVCLFVLQFFVFMKTTNDCNQSIVKETF